MQHDIEGILLTSVVAQVVLQVCAYCLHDVLELCFFGQVCRGMYQLGEERHSLEDVGEFDGALTLVDVQKVRKHHTLRKDALDLIEHFIPLLLDLWISLSDAAVDQAHADRSNLIDH